MATVLIVYGTKEGPPRRSSIGCARRSQRNRGHLAEMPSAFFQVCLTAADSSPEATERTQALLDAFAQSTGWEPASRATFAGMLAWTQYDFFTRLLTKRIVRKQVPPEERDASHDVDYTDYEAVRRFAEGFAGSLNGR